MPFLNTIFLKIHKTTNYYCYCIILTVNPFLRELGKIFPRSNFEKDSI